jgi:hypothetical protein
MNHGSIPSQRTPLDYLVGERELDTGLESHFKNWERYQAVSYENVNSIFYMLAHGLCDMELLIQ